MSLHGLLLVCCFLRKNWKEWFERNTCIMEISIRPPEFEPVYTYSFFMSNSRYR